MSESLRQALAEKLGIPTEAIALEPYFHSHRCFRAQTPSGNLFLKRTGHLEPLAEELRRDSPFEVYGDEAGAYARIARAQVKNAPRAHFQISTEEGERWLALDRIEGKRLWHYPFGSEPWQEAARLARDLRERLPGTPDGLAMPPARAVWEPALRRAPAASPAIARLLNENALELRRALAAVESGPHAWQHGQYYTINLLVDESQDKKVFIVDWESLTHGPALFDLACLLFFRNESESARQAVIDAYGELDETLLIQTELFNQLWILATLAENWWRAPDNPAALAQREMLTRDALSHGLGRLASMKKPGK